MRQVLFLAAKDIRLLLRDRPSFFFTFFWPVMMAVFFGTIFSGGGAEDAAIRVAWVDEDASAGSVAFAETLAARGQVVPVPASRSEAEDMVRRGSASAFVVLPAGFGDAQTQRFVTGAPKLQLGTDPSRKADAAMLQGLLLQAGAEGMRASFTDPQSLAEQSRAGLEALDAGGSSFEGADALRTLLLTLPVLGQTLPQDGGAGVAGFEPLVIEDVPVVRARRGPANAFAISFPAGMLWGILGCSASFGISIAVERSRGTLVRLRMAPLAASQILAGKAVACFGTALGMTTLLILLGRFVFGVVPGSWGLLALAVVSSALCFVGIMMLLSVIGRTERAAAGIGWAVLLVLSMIGGGMVPLFLMPSWLRPLTHLSPVKWSILAIEGAIWRGFTLAEMAVPCLVLIGTGAVLFLIGLRAFRWQAEG